MRVRVRVHPGARQAKAETRDGEWHVWVKEPPVDGRANEATAAALARLFDVRKSQVHLASGASSRSKVFEVEGIA